MAIQIFVTDTPFTTSPDAGHPDCICSRCSFTIAEDEFVLRLWEKNDIPQKVDDSLEWRFCPACQKTMGIQTVDNIPDEEVPWPEAFEDTPERSCRQCGCTQDKACVHPEYGPCWWVEPDLCSHCQHWPGESIFQPLIPTL